MEHRTLTLKYLGEEIPFVTAAGEGDIAEEILDIACENCISVTQNRELMKHFDALDMDESLPRELYLVVAQTITAIYFFESELAQKG